MTRRGKKTEHDEQLEATVNTLQALHQANGYLLAKMTGMLHAELLDSFAANALNQYSVVKTLRGIWEEDKATKDAAKLQPDPANVSWGDKREKSE